MYDIKKILNELKNIPEYDDQICLQTVNGCNDPFYGSRRISEMDHSENEFKYFLFNFPYINSIISELKLVRTRLMRMKPKTCLTYHQDPTKRLHIPLITNDKCFFIVDKKVIQLPADGNYYILDTTKPHTALNASLEKRLHIVGVLIDD